ncbi:unnamed protein product [Closterium sp. NIES-53]
MYPLPGTAPIEVAVGSGAAPGAAFGGAVSGGSEPGVAEFEGAGSGGVEPGGAEPGGAEPEGVEPGGPAGASPRLSPRPEPLSPQQLREWFAQRTRLWSGAAGAGDSAAEGTGAGGAGVIAGAGGTGGAAAAGPGGARTRGTEAAGTGGVGGAGAGDPTEPGAARAGGAGAVGARDGGIGAGSAGAGGAGAVDPGAGGTGAGGAGGTGGTVQPRPYFVPPLQQDLGVPSSPGLPPPFMCPPPDQSQPLFQPASPLPAPSPYTEQTGGLTERREPASRPASPVCTARRVPRLRPPLVPGTHAMALCPSSIPLRVPLPAPPESSLPAVPDPESAAASALVAELLDFAAACSLDYAIALVAESESANPPSVGRDDHHGRDTFGSPEGGDQTAADTVTPRHCALLAVPPGFLPRPSSPPLRPIVVDSGAAGGGDTGGADTRGASSGGAASPTGAGGAGGAAAGGSAVGGASGAGAGGASARRQATLSPEQLREWAVRWGSPGGGASRARAGGARAGGAGGTGAAGAIGAGAAGAGGARSSVPGVDCTGSASATRGSGGPGFWAVWWVSPGGRAGRAGAGGAGGTGPVGATGFCPRVGGTDGADVGGTTGGTGVGGARRQEPLSPQQFRDWAVSWGSPGGGAGGTGSGGAVPTGARGSGGVTTHPQPSALCHLLSLPLVATEFPVAGITPPLRFPPTDQSQPQLLPGSPLPAPASHTKVTESMTERRELETRASTPVRARRPVALSSPPASSLPHVPDFERFRRAEWSVPRACGLPHGSVVLIGHSDASWADDQMTHQSTQGYIFSLGAGSDSWRSTRSSSVLSSCCEAEIYAGAMAAQELCWLTYLLTDLGERPRSPPVLFVDNKDMIVLCQEQRLEHRTKHIALRYFLTQELQQRGQLRLAYVATQANTADVFTKALGSSDHQRFCTALGLVPTLPHLLVS